MPLHSRRHIADSAILEAYGASIITTSGSDGNNKGEGEGKGKDTSNSNPHPIGISISGWNIKTSSSTIGYESEMEELTASLQKHMNGDGSDNGSRNSRRLALPEIVFANAFVSLTRNINVKSSTCTCSSAGNEHEDENINAHDHSHDHGNKKEGPSQGSSPLVEIRMTAQDALEEWASCHAFLNEQADQNVEEIDSDESLKLKSSKAKAKGVSIIKSIDAKLWEERQVQEWQQESSSSPSSSPSSSSTSTRTASNFGKGPISNALNQCSTEFNYDWTFSSPYTGTVMIQNSNVHAHRVNAHAHVHVHEPQWVKKEASDINFSLLTDQTVPILYFDDVNLYEDDMHDNGYVSLRCKIRVMPKCFFILLSLFVRVDHVMIRVKEVRLFSEFHDDDDGDGDGIKLAKDVSWKECAWGKLPSIGLPVHVGSWRIEEKGMEQQIQAMIRNIPSITLPEGIHEHSSLQIN